MSAFVPYSRRELSRRRRAWLRQHTRLVATAVARTVAAPERGTHRARTHSLRVVPVVVLWGPAQHQLPHDTVVDGVHVVGGRRLVAWLARLEGLEVDRATALDLVRRLEEFRSTAWPHQQQRDRARTAGRVR